MSVPASVIYMWAYDLVKNEGLGNITPSQRAMYAAAGLGAAYWWGGGLPGQGQDLMTHVTAYLVGGVAVYAVASFNPAK